MTARLLPAGDRALLVEVPDLAAAVELTRRIRAAGLAGVIDLVPAARTLLVQAHEGADLTGIRGAVLELAAAATGQITDDAAADELLIEVRYDGPDLAAVAEFTGLTPAEVIIAHTGRPWQAAFIGFAPGFAYLTGGDERLRVPRRPESRTSVPAGAVALAGDFSAVYPRASPGGWQLIGTTDAVLWDIDTDPPAIVQPGRWVRFVDAANGAAGGPGAS